MTVSIHPRWVRRREFRLDNGRTLRSGSVGKVWQLPWGWLRWSSAEQGLSDSIIFCPNRSGHAMCLEASGSARRTATPSESWYCIKSNHGWQHREVDARGVAFYQETDRGTIIDRRWNQHHFQQEHAAGCNAYARTFANMHVYQRPKREASMYT
jgi:hypothetical protein